MKSPARTPHSIDQNRKVVIGDEHMQPEKIEFICSECNTGPLVTLADKTGNSNLFCRHCGASYDTEDDTVRVKQKLSIPEEVEPAVASVGGVPDISLKKQVPLRGGFEQLAKKGTIKFTSYQTTEKE
jgi:hypothetical protein